MEGGGAGGGVGVAYMHIALYTTIYAWRACIWIQYNTQQLLILYMMLFIFSIVTSPARQLPDHITDRCWHKEDKIPYILY